MDLSMNANIEHFQIEEQENENIIITSPIQSIDNTFEDEQVFIYDYLDQFKKVSIDTTENTHFIVELSPKTKIQVRVTVRDKNHVSEEFSLIIAN